MKKMMTFAIATMMALVANARPVRTQQFSTVKVNAPVHLCIAPGRSYSVNVLSGNKALASTVKWKVKNGVLRLSTNDIRQFDDIDDEVRVIVTAPSPITYEIGRDMQELSSWKTPLPSRHRSSRHTNSRLEDLCQAEK